MSFVFGFGFAVFMEALIAFSSSFRKQYGWKRYVNLMWPNMVFAGLCFWVLGFGIYWIIQMFLVTS